MNTMTAITTVAALILASAAPAFAGDARTAHTPTPQRVVMMCDATPATVSAFRREHGQRPVFVTADQVLSARATGQQWSAPRCMTAREHGRLVQAMSSYAAAR
ncbi:hypothetical protein [Brevundimonas sp.]|uniref:hypothetical protein n=1 Tax=Brevundimonas sp. TaxID=1871086 RepID=UPI001A30EBD4|nr:hypothetical protein [Brevundimonas sp.]MBJ7484837.1 hypothetical protein [Brevundimonas sp.]